MDSIKLIKFLNKTENDENNTATNIKREIEDENNNFF